MKLKLTLAHIRITVVVVALIILSGGVGYRLGEQNFRLSFSNANVVIDRTPPVSKKAVDFSLFWQVWDRLGLTYIDKTALKPDQMVFGAIKGMVGSLKDPYTAFLEPEENKQSKEDLGGAFDGVGIQLGYKKDQLAVIAPVKGMPAERSGVRTGDIILKIDEKETTGISLPEAVRLIRGLRGTKVKLALLHENDVKPYEVELIRETIVVPSVEVEYLGDGCKEDSSKCQIAHLKLTRFGDRTTDEWNKAVADILSHQPVVSGVVLDLRDNPGGYLNGAVFIGSEFIKSGTVVQQQSAGGQKEIYSVDRKGQLVNQPLVVLTNQGSASASEIVAGALQDFKRAKVVGEVTFGKGSVQEAQDLPGGGGLHVTTARWLTPLGRWIDKSGITPDVIVKDDPATKDKDEQLEKAVELLLK